MEYFGLIWLLFIIAVPTTYAIGIWHGIQSVLETKACSYKQSVPDAIYKQGILDVVKWFKNKENQDYICEYITPHYNSTYELIDRLGTEIELQFNVKVNANDKDETKK